MQVFISRRGRTNVQEIVVSTSSFGLMSQKYTKHEHAACPVADKYAVFVEKIVPFTCYILFHSASITTEVVSGYQLNVRPFFAQVAWLHWHRHDQRRCVDTYGLNPSERGMASTTSRQDLHCNTPWVSPKLFSVGSYDFIICIQVFIYISCLFCSFTVFNLVFFRFGHGAHTMEYVFLASGKSVENPAC